jgi:hypothetical protein
MKNTIVKALLTFGCLSGFAHFTEAQEPGNIERGSISVTKPGKILVSDFTRLRLDGHADIVLVQSNESFVSFSAKDGNINNFDLKIEIKDNLLSICSCQAWKFWRKENGVLTIGFKNLEEIRILGSGNLEAAGPVKLGKASLSISGAGDVSFAKLEAQELRTSISGAGDIKLTGTAKSLSVNLAGAGDFSGEKFKADSVKVSLAGAGSIRVWANTDISMALAGVGNIDHWGPGKVIKQSIAGIGSINAKGER